MSKRGTRETTLSKRKRRKNGLSASSSVLGVVETPPSQPHLMRVWQTNTEDLSTSRLSQVPIPSKPQIEEASTETIGEDVNGIAPAVKKARVRPKRRRGNDSVRYDSNVLYGFWC
jgi:hypothetical protein